MTACMARASWRVSGNNSSVSQCRTGAARLDSDGYGRLCCGCARRLDAKKVSNNFTTVIRTPSAKAYLSDSEGMIRRRRSSDDPRVARKVRC